MEVKVILHSNGDQPAIARTYNNVSDIGITQMGTYVLTNLDKNIIATFPVSSVALIECPDHDTQISLMKGPIA